MINKSKFNMSNMPYINKYLGISFSKYFLLNTVTCGFFFIWFQYKLTKVLLDINTIYTDKGRLIKYLKINLILWLLSIILCMTGLIINLAPLIWTGLFLYLFSVVIQKLWANSASNAILAFCINNYEIHYTANPLLLFLCPGLTLTWVIDSINIIAIRKYSV